MDVSAILVLDRFVSLGQGRGLDLATGHRVWFYLEAAHDPERQRQRARTAAVLAALRHRSLTPLVDFGVDRQGTWVEVAPSMGLTADVLRAGSREALDAVARGRARGGRALPVPGSSRAVRSRTARVSRVSWPGR